MVYIHKTVRSKEFASARNIHDYFKYHVHSLEREVIVPHCVEESMIIFKGRKVVVNIMGLNERDIEYIMIYGYALKEKSYHEKNGDLVIPTESILKDDYSEVKNEVLKYYNLNIPVIIMDEN